MCQLCVMKPDMVNVAMHRYEGMVRYREWIIMEWLGTGMVRYWNTVIGVTGLFKTAPALWPESSCASA